jgi:hypothetical protein
MLNGQTVDDIIGILLLSSAARCGSRAMHASGSLFRHLEVRNEVPVRRLSAHHLSRS